MKILSIRDHRDGSATLTVDMTTKEHNQMFCFGLQCLCNEIVGPGVVKAMPFTGRVTKAMKSMKTWDVEDKMSSAIVNHGFVEALKAGLKERDSFPEIDKVLNVPARAKKLANKAPRQCCGKCGGTCDKSVKHAKRASLPWNWGPVV